MVAACLLQGSAGTLLAHLDKNYLYASCLALGGHWTMQRMITVPMYYMRNYVGTKAEDAARGQKDHFSEKYCTSTRLLVREGEKG